MMVLEQTDLHHDVQLLSGRFWLQWTCIIQHGLLDAIFVWNNCENFALVIKMK